MESRKAKNDHNIFHLKGKLGHIRDWMIRHHVPPKFLFLIIGIVSTIWFFIRVIPKPSRATYPCMRVAAPFMSGMIVYLLSVGAITAISRKFNQRIVNVRFTSTFLLVFFVVVVMAITPSDNSVTVMQNNPVKMGPDDGPNQPTGKAMGLNLGRVVWAWDPKATNENCNDFHFKPENINQKVVNKMFTESVKTLTGKTKFSDSWDAMFHYFNKKKKNVDKGYTRGEKIFVKINQVSTRYKLSKADMENGFYLPTPDRPSLGTVETNPSVVLQLLRQLVNEAGVDQKDIAVGDPQNHIYGHNYKAWAAEFPSVVYLDHDVTYHGRTVAKPSKNELLFYSDKAQNDRLYDFIENADYLINVANLKPHSRAGMSLTAKNHFGSHSRTGAYHLHYSLVSPVTEGRPSNSGYKKYRVFVDILGSKYLGQNTLLYIVDGLYGGGSGEGGEPVKYFMAPFNDDWSSSILMSQDQVALESVCYDILRNEWNGINKHHARNKKFEFMPNVNGVDDYLHQAADSTNWPKGIIYDPDNSGTPLNSLGVHEHWNNSTDMKYSRNLGEGKGIELVTIPDKFPASTGKVTSSISSLVDSEKKVAEAKPILSAIDNKGVKITSVTDRNFSEGFKTTNFRSIIADDDNIKWFLTDAGIVNSSKEWIIQNQNSKVPYRDLKNIVYNLSPEGPELFISGKEGATITYLPINTNSNAVTYTTVNSGISSNNVFATAVGKSQVRWMATDKGISALVGGKWLKPSYNIEYPESMFADFPITTLATSPDGDSLYAATLGTGVTRVYKNNVDGISGASQYAQWGPIDMPSDSVLSICIAPNGDQWFGTTSGVAFHTGYNTLENWTVYKTENGLINNVVQSIAIDPEGKKWFGTKGGISVFDGTEWSSFTTKDGLISNNILTITIDKNGLIYFGTDIGVMTYNYLNGQLVCYK